MILSERGGLVVHPFLITYYNGVLSTLTVILVFSLHMRKSAQ